MKGVFLSLNVQAVATENQEVATLASLSPFTYMGIRRLAKHTCSVVFRWPQPGS